jgi:mannose-6-phosphate isomerase-like protein (cupin superfamily)
MKIPTRLRATDMAAAPLPPGRLSKLAFDTGEVELRLYAPVGVDNQVPHDRDELYFVVQGNGRFVRESEHVDFARGDVLFAAAGEHHRFVDFGGDLTLWVLFYGPRRA